MKPARQLRRGGVVNNANCKQHAPCRPCCTAAAPQTPHLPEQINGFRATLLFSSTPSIQSPDHLNSTNSHSNSIMGRLVKLLGSGIGLASEAISARKASNKSNTTASDNAGEGSSRPAPRAPNDNAPPEYVEVPDHTADELIASGKAVPADTKDPHLYGQKTHHEDDEDDDLSEEGDEEQWELDEAVSYPEPSENAPAEDIGVLTNTFMRDHPPPAYTPSETGQVRGKLPCPVIIPQRRPRDKKRGFVRAYAPVLADCGIDQQAFLDFLKTFHASTKEDKWLNVVFLGAGMVGMVPSPIAMGVSMAIQVAVGVSMEVQRRARYVPLLPFRKANTDSLLQDKHLPRPHEQRVLQTPRSLLPNYDLQARRHRNPHQS